MSQSLIISLLAFTGLFPAAFLGRRHEPGRDGIFWAVGLVALIGPVTWVAASQASIWHTDIASAIWVTIATTVALFLITAALTQEAWRLAAMLMPLMLLLGLMAIAWGGHASTGAMSADPSPWIAIHIIGSVVTYALVTIAAVAALAAIFRERALKTKQPTTLTRSLPSVAACDNLMVRLLMLSEAVLFIGMASGMVLSYSASGTLLNLDHKTILSLTAFVLIAALLAAHYFTGLRGRKAARLALTAYLLLTLGYPGVKFVSEVVLGKI